jgi:serine protease SohB
MPKLLDWLKAIWRGLPLVGKQRPRVNVIELVGVIGQVGPTRRGLTFAKLEHAIEAAFRPTRLAAVALAINSPGGSPVQSRLIHAAVRRAAVKKNVPVFAFIEDVGASGGYILALAADEIYADDSSIVGSIGVIAATFGFQDAISRLGIERRIHTAGESKSQLDPFKREDPQDVERLQRILEDMHQQFIALVRERRGTKLYSDSDIFTGAFWTAGQAKARGLIDGTAHLSEFLKARFGEDVRVRRIAPEKGSLLRRIFGGEQRGAIDPDALIGAIETRSIWARFGL